MSSTLVDDARDRAFERLYTRHVRDVYRYVLTVVRNPAEAEDVTQTTFLNAYRAIQAGAEPQAPQNWLIAIAHNACRSRVRFAMRRPREVSLDEVAELAVDEPERLNIRELLRAFGRLPSNQRTALTLREFEGRSYPEIAETLGVTVPAVEALIVRARKTLRRQASSLRGALAFFLPRTDEVGAGAAAKAAAILAVGVVAGTPAIIGAQPQHAVKPAPAATPAVVPVLVQRPALRLGHTAPRRRVSPAAPSTAAVSSTHLSRANPDRDAAPPTSAAPPEAPAPAPAAQPATAPATAPQVPSTPPVGVQVTVPDLPMNQPALPDPPVQLPPLPAVPDLPQLPAQVFPTSGI
jgi:RNA polymerase sigma factor (sigma-70 family)